MVLYERLDRVKLDTGRRSALFERSDKGIILKGTFARLKISDELSDTLPLLSYLGITYRKNEIVNDVLDWFEFGIDFMNYGNPMQELRMAIANSDDVKDLVLKMIQEMDLDILDFDETKPVYLAQYGAYFAVLEIKTTNSGYCEVTMIELNN